MALKQTRFSILRETWKAMTSKNSPALKRLSMLIRFIRLSLSLNNPTIGEILRVPKNVREAAREAVGGEIGGLSFDWDDDTDALKEPVMNPVLAFQEAVRVGPTGKMSEGNPFVGQRVEVEEAFLFEGRFNERGQLLRDKNRLTRESGCSSPYRVRHVRGTEAFLNRLDEGGKAFVSLESGRRIAEARHAARILLAKRMREEGFDNFTYDQSGFDSDQYTEFAPLTGGPFYKQLYLYDYLKQHAYAFEAWNHNPLAKRIIQLLGQYTIGRRFTLRIKNKRKQKVWEEAAKKHRLVNKIGDFWVNEANIYGEIIIDKTKWVSIDPSTIWDIITDPENVDDAYYAYQTYPTQYQQFTGYRVPGEPGAQNVPAQKFIVKQIPMSSLLHMKLNCVSNEKRGRSTLFPILGWLKRIKDLYNAQIIRQWLMASFIWDVEIKGNQADVDAYASTYGGITQPGAMHVHNENVKRTPMAAIEGTSGQQGVGTISDSILSFIATAVGVPREFLNILSVGGGSRAQALTSAEPFTKVIEDLQSKWESLIKDIFETVMLQAGLDYEKGDVEVLFPSVTKDTTTETLKNLQACESMGWISKRTAAEMAAKEMSITEYDFEVEQKKIRDDDVNGFNMGGFTPIPPDGRYGDAAVNDEEIDAPPEDVDDESDIHGEGKRKLSKSLKNL